MRPPAMWCCPGCQYDLRNIETAHCPECGGHIESLRREHRKLKEAPILLVYVPVFLLYAFGVLVIVSVSYSYGVLLLDAISIGIMACFVFDAFVITRCVLRPDLVRRCGVGVLAGVFAFGLLQGLAGLFLLTQAL